MFLAALVSVLLCSIVFCDVRARECNEGESCIVGTTCDWFNDKNDRRRHAKKGTEVFNQILEELREAVCDRKTRKVCCPEGPVNRTLLWDNSCFSTVGNDFGNCKSKSECRSSPGYQGYSYSRECGRGYGYYCCKTAESRGQVSDAAVELPVREKIPHTDAVYRPGCGTSLTNYIFGGQEAEPGAFPWMVSFVESKPGLPPYSYCGGTLITPKHVLTAAHCFPKNRNFEWQLGFVDVRLGLLDITDEENPLAKRKIKKVKVHEDYHKKAPGKKMPINDICIVTLNKDVPLGRKSGIQTCCLPPVEGFIRPNRTAVVAGWGTTSQEKGPQTHTESKLRFAYLKEFTQNECQERWNPSPGITITDDMLCAGSEEADSCGGDSGGPLMWLNEDFKYVVAGVVSFGPSSCGGSFPGVYTKVAHYLGWIEKNTQ